MKKLMLLTIFFVIGFWSGAAWGHSTYCEGFEEGYKFIKGDMVSIPICPAEPIYVPNGSTLFREGLKDGMEAASLQRKL